VSCIVLIGPMGAGKTTLGKRLAKELQLPFIDTDKKISSKHGSVTRIFETKGEEFFRDLETAELEASLQEPAVVATGGGAVLREQNRELMREHHVVFLDTASEHVIGKINLEKRPLLKSNPEKWDEIYQARVEIYRALADQTVFTGGKGIRGLLEQIRSGLPIE
jgi:shikimate kinase